ncbi:DUF808 domain-containing protein [Massilia sp. TS11]|uniref:DUF808 domain-containing protein n=1 Tax=Massilia sp. TS11 TaxID=2908003 RepID=UPI001EDB0315|nr:DUF808 domain-containing protein [Massilia sp. TS11]MCG2585201.1 DUF808 domain-containing protein [Massilia sp. TS11]
MAGTSLLALIDDIATLLDDVALLSKAAAQKTAGVLGDDLALNAEQVAGVAAERELPVVWAVAKGSLRNKAILVPGALAISAFAPWAITPMLMVGGVYLCFEGVEKLVHGKEPAEDQALREAVDLVAYEKDKIAGAIRTDFVLSAEIIVIALGIVAGAPFERQVLALVAVALAMTVGVYGVVAAIVKMDDAGRVLIRRGGALAGPGRLLLAAAPKLMKILAVAGTAAMFTVGGGILSHGWHALHDWLSGWTAQAGALAGLAGVLADAAVGIAAGAIALGAVSLLTRLRGAGR